MLRDQLLNSYHSLSDLCTDPQELERRLSAAGLELIVEDIGGEPHITAEPQYRPSRQELSIYFMDQVLFDSEFFDEQTWHNTLDYLSGLEPDAVWVSGAILRIDRPEYKKQSLVSFWMDKNEVRATLKNGDYSLNDPLPSLMDREFEIADRRFSELRSAFPDSELYYHWSTDDGFSTNRIIHYMALKHRRELKERLKAMSQRADTLYSRLRQKSRARRATRAELQELKESIERGELSADYEPEIEALRSELNEYETELEDLAEGFTELKKDMEVSEEELEYFRPRKESPVHQMIVSEGVRFMHDRYQEILDRHDITFLKGEQVIEVNGTKLVVNENARLYDSPIINRAKRLTEEVDRKATRLADDGILAVIEGHQARYDFMRIDTPPSNDELNGKYEGLWFQPQNSYPQSVYACVLPVFHDMDAVSDYVKGRRPNRLSGRKPVGSRTHYAIKMLDKGGIGALFGLHIDSEGRVGRELISYQALKDGLELPVRWYEEEGHADMHLFYPATDIALIDGAKQRRLRKWQQLRTFRGKRVVPAMLKTVGDDIEGNSDGWKGAGAEYRRDSALDYQAELQELTTPKQTLDQKVEFVSRMLARKLKGAWENVGDFQQMDTDYYLDQLQALYTLSPLEKLATFIGSNHSFLSLRGSGINPHEILMYIINSGLLDEDLAHRLVFDTRDARSNAITFRLSAPDLGPYRNTVVHDPSWSKTPGRTALNYGPLDSAIVDTGHYHLSGESAEPFQGRPNQFRFGSMHPCYMRVSSTDVKKSGRVRNRGSKTTLYPAFKGDSLPQVIVFENEPRLLWYESRRAMRLNIKRQEHG